MAEYYLIAQLPTLDGLAEDAPLPITEEAFLELCRRFLRKKALLAVENLSFVPPKEPKKTGFSLVDAHSEWERSLRLALGKARGDKMKKKFDLPEGGLKKELCAIAARAVEIENPMEAEMFLLQHRLAFLESVRPSDPFAEEFIFYYALKLKLLWRIRGFDAVQGEAAYRAIYHSILNADKREASL